MDEAECRGHCWFPTLNQLSDTGGAALERPVCQPQSQGPSTSTSSWHNTLSANYPVSFSSESSFSYEFYCSLTTLQKTHFPHGAAAFLPLPPALCCSHSPSLPAPSSPTRSPACTLKCFFYPACSWEGKPALQITAGQQAALCLERPCSRARLLRWKLSISLPGEGAGGGRTEGGGTVFSLPSSS